MPSCGVCLSVTFVYYVKTNRHIFNFFRTILLLLHTKHYGNVSTEPPPVTGTSNAGGVVKIAILASSRVVNDPTAKSYTYSCAGPWRRFVVRERRTTKCL